MKKVLIDKNDYTSRQKVLFKTKQKPLSLQNGYKIVPTFDIPEIDLGVSKQYSDSMKILSNQINETTERLRGSLSPLKNYSNRIQGVLEALPELTVPKIDMSNFQEIASSLQKRYSLFFNECIAIGLLPSHKYIDDFEYYFSEFGKIDEDFIINQYTKDFDEIAESFSSSTLYQEQYMYLKLAIQDFSERKYVECTMLLFAALDYIIVYSLLNKEKGKYNPLRKALKEDLSDIDRAFIQYEYQKAFKKITEDYYANDNSLEDPFLINRNRLMHGIMDIDNINKVDCIKLFYLLESIVDIKVEAK